MMRAAGTKASPAETGDGPEGSLRHEESDTCGPGDRMQGTQPVRLRCPPNACPVPPTRPCGVGRAKSPRSCASERGNG
ncbi:hypothetical protein BCEP4_1650008 [Burkholderia cepacia]|nr:hypothetical protein BCEP4_1650008 [Burkholderia cepacia]